MSIFPSDLMTRTQGRLLRGSPAMKVSRNRVNLNGTSRRELEWLFESEGDICSCSSLLTRADDKNDEILLTFLRAKDGRDGGL